MKLEKIENLKTIGAGTEGVVYSDGEYAYKVVTPSGLSAEPEDILDRFKNKNYKNVVNVYDAIKIDNERVDAVIVKMELLEDWDVMSYDAWDRFSNFLWQRNPNIEELKEFLSFTDNEQIKKIVNDILSGMKELSVNQVADLSAANIMYDKKTNNFKLIDLG